MREAVWARRARPDLGPDQSTVGVWHPVSSAGLTADRRRLGTHLSTRFLPAGGDERAVECLLLAFEELVSNALRHGRGTITATLTATNTSWLLEVSDDASERPPVPAVDRDPARGGLGLHMVARIAGAHGWTVVGTRKVVWARIDHTETGELATPSTVPPPRQPGASESQLH